MYLITYYDGLNHERIFKKSISAVSDALKALSNTYSPGDVKDYAFIQKIVDISDKEQQELEELSSLLLAQIPS